MINLTDLHAGIELDLINLDIQSQVGLFKSLYFFNETLELFSVNLDYLFGVPWLLLHRLGFLAFI